MVFIYLRACAATHSGCQAGSAATSLPCARLQSDVNTASCTDQDTIHRCGAFMADASNRGCAAAVAVKAPHARGVAPGDKETV